MSEMASWLYFDGPEPASLRDVMSALRREAPITPTDHKAQMEAEFFATLDTRLGRSGTTPPTSDAGTEGVAGSEGASGSEGTEMGPPTEVDPREVDPLTEVGSPALSFTWWAELAPRLLGRSDEEKLAILHARGLTPEAWEQADALNFEALSADAASGRVGLQALYEASCHEEMIRRRAEAEEAAAAEGARSSVGKGSVGEGAPGEGARGDASSRKRSAPCSYDTPVAIGTADSNLDSVVAQVLGRLPFKSPAEVGPPVPVKAVSRTMQTRAVPAELGKTAPLDLAETIQRVVAALPLGGAAGGRAVIVFPSLTVRQYLSLRWELSASPAAGRAAILARYRVPHEASYRALEQHWREQFAARSELRHEMSAAVLAYAEYLYQCAL